RFWAEGIKSTWGREVYGEHLKAFNEYNEGDGSGKQTLSDFINAYNSLLMSVKENGFDELQSILPVGDDDTLVDGAHRASACHYFKRPVTIVRLELPAPQWDYRFF